MPEIQTDVGGLRAIELNYRPLRDIATGRSICYLTRTQLNTPGLGILMPETFRPVAEKHKKSHRLFTLEFMQLAEAIRDLNEAGRPFNWISLDMPMSIIKDRAAATIADKICEQFAQTANSFCFIIPEEVLSEKKAPVADNVAHLRRMGYHVMLSNFGESGCPFIRLSDFNFDFVMLSPSVSGNLGKSERTDQAVHSIIDFINNMDSEPVADGVQSSSQAEALYEFGCNYCAGPLSGDYVQLSDLID